MRPWRMKPQTTATKASTSSTVMIMTSSQAARRNPGRSGVGRFGGMSAEDTKNSGYGTTRLAAADERHAGWRLDRFLAQALPEFSRARLQQLLGEGAVTLSGRTVKDANHRVKGR